MAVIGGFGGVAGPLIGAAYYGAVTLFEASPVVRLLATGGGGLLLLMLTPGGLSHLVFAVRDGWLRRMAERRHIAVPSLVGASLPGKVAPIAPPPRSGPERLVPTYVLERQWALVDKGGREVPDG